MTSGLIPSKPTCCLCEQGVSPNKLLVLAGPGPISEGYCPSCAALGIYPVGLWVAYLYTVWPEVRDDVLEEVERSLKHAGKDLAWFDAECKQAMKKLEEWESADSNHEPADELDLEIDVD